MTKYKQNPSSQLRSSQISGTTFRKIISHDSNIYQLVREAVDFEEVCRHYRVSFNSAKKTFCLFHCENILSFHNYGTHGYCFGCNKSVDAVNLESFFAGIPPYEAAVSLAKRYKIPLPELSPTERIRAKKQARVYELLMKLSVYANKRIKKQPKVLRFLKKKGIDQADIDHWLIGYIGEENPLTRSKLKEKTLELAKEIGLVNEYDKDYFKNRIIYPVWNRGRIVSLIGRAFPERVPKFLHLKKTDLVQKRVAFSENLRHDFCIITEGITDAIALIKSGIPACALIGTAPGEEGKEALSKAKGKLYFAFDVIPQNEDEEIR